MKPGAVWAAWQPTFDRWAGWSARQVSRQAKCWSRKIDLCLPRWQKKGREGSEGQSHKQEERKVGVKWGGARDPIAKEWGLYLDICAGVPEFLVTPLQMRSVCLLSQGGLKSQSAAGCRRWTGDVDGVWNGLDTYVQWTERRMSLVDDGGTPLKATHWYTSSSCRLTFQITSCSPTPIGPAQSPQHQQWHRLAPTFTNGWTWGRHRE